MAYTAKGAHLRTGGPLRPVSLNLAPSRLALPCSCRCISKTQFCKDKQLHTCADGLHCGFDDKDAVGCMPSDCDTPPAPRCANSAHDQCISEVRSPAKHATLAPCMPLAWAQLHDSFVVTQPAQCCSNSPNLLACPLSFTTCYYLQTS